MTLQTEAIYEHGVLRPLMPLNLQEQQLVSLSISTATDAGIVDSEAARQRAVLVDYVAKGEARPGNSPQDGLTNRDRDRLIYGQ